MSKGDDYNPGDLLDMILSHSLNSFLGGTHDGRLSFTSKGMTPRIDLIESKDRFTLYADVPGMSKADLDIRVKDGQVCLSGNRSLSSSFKSDEQNGHLVCQERIRGPFQRCFNLFQHIDDSRIQAKLSDGTLRVELPKAPESSGNRVTIL